MRAHDRIAYYEDLGRHDLLTRDAAEMKMAQEQEIARQIDDELSIKFEEMKRIVAVERKRQEELLAAPVVAERPPAPPSAPRADRGNPALRTALAYCLGRAGEIDELTSLLRTYSAPLSESEASLGGFFSGCTNRVFAEIVRLLALPGAGANITPSALRRAGGLRERPALDPAPPFEESKPSPPPAKDNDCFRGGDPFGCQPRK